MAADNRGNLVFSHKKELSAVSLSELEPEPEDREAALAEAAQAAALPPETGPTALAGSESAVSSSPHLMEQQVSLAVQETPDLLPAAFPEDGTSALAFPACMAQPHADIGEEVFNEALESIGYAVVTQVMMVIHDANCKFNVAFDFDAKHDTAIKVAKELQDANIVTRDISMEDLSRDIEHAIIVRCRKMVAQQNGLDGLTSPERSGPGRTVDVPPPADVGTIVFQDDSQQAVDAGLDMAMPAGLTNERAPVAVAVCTAESACVESAMETISTAASQEQAISLDPVSEQAAVAELVVQGAVVETNVNPTEQQPKAVPTIPMECNPSTEVVLGEPTPSAAPSIAEIAEVPSECSPLAITVTVEEVPNSDVAIAESITSGPREIHPSIDVTVQPQLCYAAVTTDEVPAVQTEDDHITNATMVEPVASTNVAQPLLPDPIAEAVPADPHPSTEAERKHCLGAAEREGAPETKLAAAVSDSRSDNPSVAQSTWSSIEFNDDDWPAVAPAPEPADLTSQVSGPEQAPEVAEAERRWVSLGWANVQQQSLAEAFRTSPATSDDPIPREEIALLQRSLAYLIPSVNEGDFKQNGVWCDATSKAFSSFQTYHSLSNETGITEEKFWETVSDEVRKRDDKENEKKAKREAERKRSQQVREQRKQLQDRESALQLEQMMGICQMHLEKSAEEARGTSKVPPLPTQPTPTAASGSWGTVAPQGMQPPQAPQAGLQTPMLQQPQPEVLSQYLPQHAPQQSFAARTQTPPPQHPVPPSGSRPSSASSSRGPPSAPQQAMQNSPGLATPVPVVQQPPLEGVVPPVPAVSAAHSAHHFQGPSVHPQGQPPGQAAVGLPPFTAPTGTGGLPCSHSAPALQAVPSQVPAGPATMVAAPYPAAEQLGQAAVGLPGYPTPACAGAILAAPGLDRTQSVPPITTGMAMPAVDRTQLPPSMCVGMALSSPAGALPGATSCGFLDGRACH